MVYLRKRPKPTIKIELPNKLKKLMKLACEVTFEYPQEWGDCYIINGTIKNFLNKNQNKEHFGLIQIDIEVDHPVNDPELGETTGSSGKLSHNVIYLKSRWEKKDIPIWWDFSTVLGNRIIIDWNYDGELGGEVDEDLLNKLNKKLENTNLKNYQNKQIEVIHNI